MTILCEHSQPQGPLFLLPTGVEKGCHCGEGDVLSGGYERGVTNSSIIVVLAVVAVVVLVVVAVVVAIIVVLVLVVMTAYVRCACPH